MQRTPRVLERAHFLYLETKKNETSTNNDRLKIVVGNWFTQYS